MQSLENVEKYTQSEEEWEQHLWRQQQEKLYEELRRRKKIEETYENSSTENHKRPEPSKNGSPKDVFFEGCKTMEEIEKRYRSLAKVYHPDMPTGDKETFQKILEEYNRRKEKR